MAMAHAATDHVYELEEVGGQAEEMPRRKRARGNLRMRSMPAALTSVAPAWGGRAWNPPGLQKKIASALTSGRPPRPTRA